MPMKLYHYSGILAVMAAFGLAACEGDTGPQGAAGIDGIDGQDGLGYVPVPAVDETLADYNPALPPEDDQTIRGQFAAGDTVWEIPIDGQILLPRGDGALPAIGGAVRYDTAHDELWIEVDGEWVPFTDFVVGDSPSQSLGCTAGVPKPCIEVTEIRLGEGDYAVLALSDIDHGPVTDISGFAHYGVKSDVADMPHSGTASYSGDSYVAVKYIRPDASTGDFTAMGTVTIDVDFGLGVDGELTTWNVNNGDPGADYYNLDGTAIIAGNSYDGTLSGTVIGSEGVEGDDTLDVDGTFSGTFYGPAVNDSLDSQTAGIFEASDDVVGVDPETATGEIVGGFIANADSFSPADP